MKQYCPRNRPRRPWLILLAMASTVCASAAGAAADNDDQAADRVEFNRDVRPILADKCFACHGPDDNQRATELRLDRADAALADLGGYRAIVPGDPATSELYRRITSADPDERMPAIDSGKQLNDREIDVLRRWIEQGATWQDHWSLIPPQRPHVPEVDDTSWPRGAIDHFVLARLERESLVPSPEADRRTLLRRLSFDLTGLPPEPGAMAAFLADASPDAYEKHVERLLAAPQFGERMAMQWLDLVRYADTNGIHGDNHRDVAAYRDYVIAAFNSNKTFDRFTREQLAGDLLDGSTIEDKIASGYNRLVLTTREGGAQPKEYLAKYAADRVRNAATVWLGATLECAECHDHKFDPFTMRDFYRLEAFFADLEESAVSAQQPGLTLPTPEQAAAVERVNAEIAAAKADLASETTERDDVRRRFETLRKQRAALESRMQTMLISKSVEPRPIRILARGNWMDESGEVVTPGVPACLRQPAADVERLDRLDLANWLVDPANPLVTRVAVNRLWQLCFGAGIVRTPDDFGSRGAWPTHPELLDWLAVEFIESDWNVKHMLRLMVTSATYRQSSEVTEPLRQADPENRLLTRQMRMRLDAEMIRDNALTVSGLLSAKMGGPSVKPYQPAGYWSHLNFPKRTYEHDVGEDQYRRGVYTYWCRTFLHPSMLAFDAPSREACAVKRPRSNTPLQALVLLNDPTYVEAARAFAARIMANGGNAFHDRLSYAFQLALAREPRADETAVLEALYYEHARHYAEDEQAARALLDVGLSPPPEAVDTTELAAWTSVARVMLNLHETITRY